MTRNVGKPNREGTGLGRRLFLKLGLWSAALLGAPGSVGRAAAQDRPGPGDFHHPLWGRLWTKEFQAWRAAASHPDQISLVQDHDGVPDNDGLLLASRVRTETARTGWENGPGTTYEVDLRLRKESTNLYGRVDLVNPYDDKVLMRMDVYSSGGWGLWRREKGRITCPNAGLKVVLHNGSNSAGGQFDMLVHTVDIRPWPFGDAKPPPRRIQQPFWWVEPLMAGATWNFDFRDCFRAAEGGDPITGYDYDGPEPHSWDGTVLTLTPTVPTDGPQERRVYARSARSRSDEGAEFLIHVQPSAPRLSPRGAPPVLMVERGRGVPAVQADDYVQDGHGPCRFAPEGEVPDWLRVEHNGLVWGRAPDEVLGRQEARVRVVDRRGDSVIVPVVYEVADRFGRTPTLTLEPGTKEKPTEITYDLIRGHQGSGAVIRLPDGHYRWRVGTGIAHAGPNEPPMIVTGGPGAVIDDVLAIEKGTRGLLIEGITVRRPLGLKNWRGTCYTGGPVERIFLYDLTVEVQAVKVDPDDGKDWRNRETEAYVGKCYDLRSGSFVVLDHCVGRKAAEIFIPGGAGTQALYDCRSDLCSDDHGLTGTVRNLVVAGFVTGRFAGNHIKAQHRDLWQAFGDNAPVPWRVVYDGCFLSARDDRVTQGHFASWHGWGSRGKSLEEAFHQHVIRDCVILSAVHAHGLTLERYTDLLLERVLVAGHPDSTETSQLFVRKPSEALFDGVIFQAYHDDFDAPRYRHLLKRGPAGIVNLSAEGAPEIEEIFPDWRNAALPDEARVKMDPTWHAAHPGMGPRLSWPERG